MFSIGPCPRPFYLCVHSFVVYQTCGHGILKTNEPILMLIGASGPQSKGIKRSALKVTTSKVKVTGGRSKIWRPGGDILDDSFRPNRFSSSGIWPLFCVLFFTSNFHFTYYTGQSR